MNRRSTHTKTKHTLYRNSIHACLSLGFKRHLIIARVQIERSSIRASSSARTPHHTLPCHAHLNTLSRSLDGGHHMSRRCHRGGLASPPHTPHTHAQPPIITHQNPKWKVKVNGVQSAALQCSTAAVLSPKGCRHRICSDSLHQIFV